MDRSGTISVYALVAAARFGDRQAFRRLYDRYASRVFRTALRLTGDRHEAEEVVQEVFVTLYRKLEGFDGQAAFTTWLYRITVNACYDRMRKHRRRAAYHGESLDAGLEAVHPAAGAETYPGLGLLRQEVTWWVEQALARLHPDLRATLVLKEVEALSYREIARILGCSEGTVASRLARARRQVAATLRSAGIDAHYFNQG